MVEGGPVYKTICVDKVEKEEEEKWVRGVEAFCIVTYAESGGWPGQRIKRPKRRMQEYQLKKIVKYLRAERIKVIKFHLKSKKKE